ncbi:hypothetical protein K402DRAFT_389065 [Aulographum hederae CBS 113979]|uniref:Cnl2/NKP2 family protein-domain-containing protein n=1 Tax=Aulographum hederae CBS 113979 TaxID=1176131 RepID=A0A6G1HET7_9PEZI|nr:hypothetical protein K402DRAFT_389065 [Aulographum hederae CBS 113979]
MAPTETTILQNFLLPPAPLPTIISLRKFTDLFPAQHRANPQIAILYRELQHQRAIDTDDVKENIQKEVKRGEKMRREVVKTRRRAEREELGEGMDGRDVGLERDLYGPSAEVPKTKPHTLQTLLPEMEQAERDMEEEIEELEREAEALLSGVKATIGDLSDLRYGRFNRVAGLDSNLGQEVLEGLKRLEAVCDEAAAG